MILFRRPSTQRINEYLEGSRALSFSYTEVGATNRKIPEGYVVDHNRVLLGRGEAVFERAIDVVRRMEMFPSWAELYCSEPTLQAGSNIAVLARHLGFWSLNPCRIVYLLDHHERGIDRFGFAYGTLPDHLERGEERFVIERHRDDGFVWFDLLAFSRPAHLLTKLGYPVTRLYQMRFARDCLGAISTNLAEPTLTNDTESVSSSAK